MNFRTWFETFGRNDDPTTYAANNLGGQASDYQRLGSGGEKTAVLMPNQKVARFYHNTPFIPYKSSEGRASELLANDKLMPKIQYVPGKGYDIVERVVPIEDILRKNAHKTKTDQNGNPVISSKSGKPLIVTTGIDDFDEANKSVLQAMIKSYYANPLLKNRIVEASPIESSAFGKNTGLVVRNGQAYVVALMSTELWTSLTPKD